MQLTRRGFGRTLLAAPLARAATKPNSRINGVLIGIQSYSFRDRPLNAAVQAMAEIGFSSCELWQGHVEPKMSREPLRNWRTSVSMDFFREVRKKFDAAGIDLFAYNYSFRDDFNDEEIARGFEMAKAMGVKCLTASSNVTTAARVEPFAAKAKMLVGMHNHSNIKPNEFARPEDFEGAMQSGPHIAVNFDLGHYIAAGYDPIAFIEKHHKRIVAVHLKDRKKNQADNMPFGEGDTPLKEVLLLLRKKKYAIPACIEYEYKGADTMVEVRRCFDYCKKALA